MTGISTVSSRRFPASLSSKPIISIVARDRLNGGDHFFIGHFVDGTDEARVAAIHEDAALVLGIASQRGDQLPSFRVVEWTEIHRRSPFQKKRHQVFTFNARL